jgi:RecA/RadA recombinase
MSIKKAERQIKKHSIKLLVVDTINNHFRSERGKKGGAFQKIKQDFLDLLKKILILTTKFNLITVMTAQVTPNFINDAPIKERPVGVQYLNHFFSELIHLKRKDETKCYIHLVNSSFLPEKKLLYTLSSKGIKDYTL